MVKDLSRFKIGDMRNPTVRATGGKQKGAEEPAAEEASVGFPAIESRLESGTVDSLAEELRSSYEALEEMSVGKDMRKKAAAKRAMVAYERTADLFEYLFQTKDSIQNPEPK